MIFFSRILLFLLFPVFLSAQINRAYGVIEIGSFPTSSTTGPKFAYRTVDSSFYRWVSGNTWVKIIEPSIIPDTLYLTEEIGTSYKVSGDTINLTPYLLKSDTTAMLVKYIERGDTASMLSNYPTFGDVNTSLGNYLPILGGTLTGTGGAGFIGFPSQVSAPGTPASGLNVYAQGSSFNWKGTDGYERQITSTLTGGHSYDLPNVNGTFALGTGTADRSARWSATNTLTTGNFTDNGTKVQALLPFQLQQWTTAGRPTGVTGYEGYNTTGNGKEWYNGTRWAYARESSAATGTANRVLLNDSNGQIADNSGLTFVNPSTLTGSVFSSMNVTTSSTATANNQYHVGTIFNHSYTPGAFTGGRHYVASFLTNDVTGATIAIGRPHSLGFNATITSDFSTRQFIFDSGNSGGNIIFRKAGTEVLQIGGTTLSYPGYYYSTSTQSALGLSLALLANPPVGTTQGYIAFRESNTNGYKAAFGHDGNGSAAIYAQRGNTNFVSTDMKFRLSGINGYAEFLNNTAGVLLGGGTTAQTPTEVNGLIRYNSDSTLYQIYQGGTRAYIATRAYARSLVAGLPTTWLKTELEAGRDVDITGVSSTDFRIRNTRVQFDGTFKVGQDSSFKFNPATQLGEIKYSTNYKASMIGYEFGLFSNSSSQRFKISDWTNTNYIQLERTNFAWGSEIQTSNFRWAIRTENRNTFSNILFVSQDTTSNRNNDIMYGQIGSVFGDNGFYTRHIFLSNSKTNNHGFIFSGQTTGTRFFTIIQNADSLLSVNKNGTVIAHKYGTGTKEAADLSKTQSNYIAGFATDGTVLDLGVGTGLLISGGLLTATGSADGNGIYTGSGTLSSHTTRAAIPSTGNLLFTQKYNSNADSAWIQVVNGLDGNREVRLGLTDTASTGFSTLVLKQDADNEVMAWELRSSDGLGATRLTGDGGNISATVDEGFEIQLSGMVRAKREAYAEITSTSSPQTLSSVYSDNLINQGGTQATFTLNMPASPEDGQVCYITFNNAISTLTIDGNGETIVGSAVTTGVPGSQRKFKFYSGIGWIKQY